MDFLPAQSWALFALSVSIIFARLMFRRIMLKSFRHLQADDWVMIFLLLPLTASVILTVSVSEAQLEKQRTYRFVLEVLHITMTWLVKVCLLVLYWRIFPVVFSTARRRYIQVVSTMCALFFITTQALLLSWCRPTQLDESTYHNYAIVSLVLSTLTTILVLIIPIPFIPTPRRLLLTILMVTGISTLILGTLGRIYIIMASMSQKYLFYYIYEITLLIVFANLPFLTSLVATTTPARIREFSRNISFSRDGTQAPLSPWPRSRRVSIQDIASPPLRSSRLSSTATVVCGKTEGREWKVCIPVTRPGNAKIGFGVE
ncbi:hypothetical protein C7974DRAFT_97482 [Boeremia exigua]|uniref:uncharacterized protein n=1 Tax=Boeremia exigua TaxID=749465 RepID=UPI001E8E30C2|nr:uncharacterized protein C7974DRAFT_97482 [Boeremia exigua]KAH6642221.1 hypothetical protein C7974DRAFT_97482 [Boeremia exigua]